MKVVEVMTAELHRLGVAGVPADLDFDPIPLAERVIKAAGGELIETMQ
jgi:hypothetical protein